MCYQRSSVAVTVNVLNPSISITSNVQSVSDTIAEPMEVSSLNTSTVEPASTVPARVNGASLTVCDGLVMATAGATVSNVMLTAAVASDVLPASSVAVTVNALAPSVSVTANVQSVSVTVAAPVDVPPLSTSTVAFASTVPVRVNDASLRICAVVVMATVGATVSNVMLTAAVASDVLPSVAVTSVQRLR